MQDELSLQNISPVDGRYKQKLSSMSSFFSEYGLIRYRVLVEVNYLIFLSENGIAPKLSRTDVARLQSIYKSFSVRNSLRIKEIEHTVNHDIKAVEYYLQEELAKIGLSSIAPFVHWGITSDDTNNLAYGIALGECNTQVLVPQLKKLLTLLKAFAEKNKKSFLLARTHGQPAVPTTFGKEISNFYMRLNSQYKRMITFRFEGKLMGAVGNLNVHKYSFPKINWVTKSKSFVRSLGLIPNVYTTQILPLDNWIEYFQIVSTINGILGGLNRDIWTYIMLEEVKLKKKEGEVGSSTMPQKVNPIDFENAEGNGEVANAYFQLYERKLISSRLQRDLSDSVVKRTIGTALSHTFLSWSSISHGLEKIEFDSSTSQAHLNDHYEALMEAVQTRLRLKNDTQGYEKVKKLSRGKKITKKIFQEIVVELGLEELKVLTPESYCGYAEELSEDRS